jgi:hypothetical protein
VKRELAVIRDVAPKVGDVSIYDVPVKIGVGVFRRLLENAFELKNFPDVRKRELEEQGTVTVKRFVVVMVSVLLNCVVLLRARLWLYLPL